MRPGASVSGMGPYQLSASCRPLGELGPDPGPFPSHPGWLIRALPPGSPAAGVAGSEDSGEAAGQTGEAQDFQNNRKLGFRTPSTAGQRLSRESGDLGSGPRSLVYVTRMRPSLPQDLYCPTVLMSSEVPLTFQPMAELRSSVPPAPLAPAPGSLPPDGDLKRTSSAARSAREAS